MFHRVDNSAGVAAFLGTRLHTSNGVKMNHASLLCALLLIAWNTPNLILMFET